MAHCFFGQLVFGRVPNFPPPIVKGLLLEKVDAVFLVLENVVFDADDVGNRRFAFGLDGAFDVRIAAAAAFFGADFSLGFEVDAFAFEAAF